MSYVIISIYNCTA